VRNSLNEKEIIIAIWLNREDKDHVLIIAIDRELQRTDTQDDLFL
jgi:hypothetical protein